MGFPPESLARLPIKNKNKIKAQYSITLIQFRANVAPLHQFVPFEETCKAVNDGPAKK